MQRDQSQDAPKYEHHEAPVRELAADANIVLRERNDLRRYVEARLRPPRRCRLLPFPSFRPMRSRYTHALVLGTFRTRTLNSRACKLAWHGGFGQVAWSRKPPMFRRLPLFAHYHLCVHTDIAW
jgi:hypothetical protein